MTFESIISIVSGIFGIISGIVGFWVFVRKHINLLPRPCAKPGSSSGQPPVESVRNSTASEPRPKAEKYPAEAATAASGSGDDEAWKATRDAVGDLAPAFFTLLGFCTSLLFAILSKIGTGELNSWHGDQSMLGVLLGTITLTIIGFAVGSVTACLLLGSTPLHLRYAFITAVVAGSAGGLIGWLIADLQGFAIGLTLALVVAVLPIADRGAVRFTARIHARRLVRKIIEDPTRAFVDTRFFKQHANALESGANFVLNDKLLPKSDMVLAEAGLILGVPYHTIAEFLGANKPRNDRLLMALMKPHAESLAAAIKAKEMRKPTRHAI